MIKNSCHDWFLRNHTSYDCHLCYTFVNWYLQVFFFLIFQNFDFLGQLKWQKMAQNDKKNCVCLILFLRNCTSYNCDFWCTFLKWWYLQQSFSFFKILIFWVFRGVKGQKNNYLFFKFISKCQKRNSEVCPAFFTFVFFYDNYIWLGKKKDYIRKELWFK